MAQSGLFPPPIRLVHLESIKEALGTPSRGQSWNFLVSDHRVPITSECALHTPPTLSADMFLRKPDNSKGKQVSVDSGKDKEPSVLSERKWAMFALHRGKSVTFKF